MFRSVNIGTVIIHGFACCFIAISIKTVGIDTGILDPCCDRDRINGAILVITGNRTGFASIDHRCRRYAEVTNGIAFCVDTGFDLVIFIDLIDIIQVNTPIGLLLVHIEIQRFAVAFKWEAIEQIINLRPVCITVSDRIAHGCSIIVNLCTIPPFFPVISEIRVVQFTRITEITDFEVRISCVREQFCCFSGDQCGRCRIIISSVVQNVQHDRSVERTIIFRKIVQYV